MWSAISGFPNLVFDFDLGIEVYRTQFRLGLQLQTDLIKNIICSLEFTKAEPKLDINILPNQNKILLPNQNKYSKTRENISLFYKCNVYQSFVS